LWNRTRLQEQSNIDNPEKLAKYGRQYKEKHNTICVGHHYTQTNLENEIIVS
jgi:hypothetical protein